MSIATTASHSHFVWRVVAEAPGEALAAAPVEEPVEAPGGEAAGAVREGGRSGPLDFMWYVRRSLQGEWLGAGPSPLVGIAPRDIMMAPPGASRGGTGRDGIRPTGQGECPVRRCSRAERAEAKKGGGCGRC